MSTEQACELIHNAAHLARKKQQSPHGLWWEQAAFAAVYGGRWRIFTGRTSDTPYLLRCWLTPKAPGDSDLHSVHLATVLHFFARGDDDDALHDHPCDFVSYLLEGMYSEELPALDWPQRGRDYNSQRISVNHHTGEQRVIEPIIIRGPLTTIFKDHCAGDRIIHKAEDLHAVKNVEPGTVSIVQMGAFRRPWGFHPPGKPWVEAHAYLDVKKETA